MRCCLSGIVPGLASEHHSRPRQPLSLKLPGGMDGKSGRLTGPMESQRPILITQNGSPVSVIISPEDYDRICRLAGLPAGPRSTPWPVLPAQWNSIRAAGWNLQPVRGWHRWLLRATDAGRMDNCGGRPLSDAPRSAGAGASATRSGKEPKSE